MKLKILLSLGIISFCAQLNATQFFSLQHNKIGRNFNNEISELNSTNGETVNKVQLTNSYKFRAEKLALPENPNMFFYALTDKKKAVIQIINKSDLEAIKTVDIDHINFRVIGTHLYQFFYLTDDHQTLLLHTGFKKSQNLTVIDVASGQVIKQVALSKNKNEISVSDDKKYILINDTSKDQLTLVKTTDYSVVMVSQLGKYRQYGTIHNDFLYLTKYKGQKHKKSYWVQALNLQTKEKTDLKYESNEQPVFAVSSQSGQLLNLSMMDRGKTASLVELNGKEISQLGTFPMKIIPTKMFIDNEFNRLLIQGKGKVANINLGDLTQYTSTKLPFDTVNYLHNKTGELLYLKEGSGSEIAVIDVKTGELIERSGTGRQGVKFGQFMASVALAGVGASAGYMVYFAKYSNTGFTLNHNEDKIYVINSKTNDVSHFNAADLSDRKAIATGGGTFLVHQGNDANAPLWVFSKKRINQINDKTFELSKEIDYESIVGFDLEEDYFIIKTEKNMQTYDMKTGNLTNQWPLSNANLIWSEK